MSKHCTITAITTQSNKKISFYTTNIWNMNKWKHVCIRKCRNVYSTVWILSHKHSGAMWNFVMSVSPWRKITCLERTQTHTFFGQPHWPHCQCIPSCIYGARGLSGPEGLTVESWLIYWFVSCMSHDTFFFFFAFSLGTFEKVYCFSSTVWYNGTLPHSFPVCILTQTLTCT